MSLTEPMEYDIMYIYVWYVTYDIKNIHVSFDVHIYESWPWIFSWTLTENHNTNTRQYSVSVAKKNLKMAQKERVMVGKRAYI